MRGGPVVDAQMRACLLAVVLVSLAGPASAQVLSGRVVDASSGEGVPGAIVVGDPTLYGVWLEVRKATTADSADLDGN
jgi:hypothetical protein